jgi:hypothetical protein
VCSENAGHATPHGKHCKHFTKAQITDAVFADRIRRDLPIGDAVYPPLHAIGCTRTPSGEACSQETGGPASLDFNFIGKGARGAFERSTSSPSRTRSLDEWRMSKRRFGQ